MLSLHISVRSSIRSEVWEPNCVPPHSTGRRCRRRRFAIVSDLEHFFRLAGWPAGWLFLEQRQGSPRRREVEKPGQILGNELIAIRTAFSGEEQNLPESSEQASLLRRNPQVPLEPHSFHSGNGLIPISSFDSSERRSGRRCESIGFRSRRASGGRNCGESQHPTD